MQWQHEKTGIDFDADDEEHMQWVYQQALKRAQQYGIQVLQVACLQLSLLSACPPASHVFSHLEDEPGYLCLTLLRSRDIIAVSPVVARKFTLQCHVHFWLKAMGRDQLIWAYVLCHTDGCSTSAASIFMLRS